MHRIFIQTAQGIFYLTDIQVSGGFLDKIWKLLTYETPLYHKPLQSYQLSKTVRFFWPTIFEPFQENWRRPPGRPHTTWMKNIYDDLSSLDLGIHEARDLAQNRPLWRLVTLHSLCTRSGACYYWIGPCTRHYL